MRLRVSSSGAFMTRLRRPTPATTAVGSRLVGFELLVGLGAEVRRDHGRIGAARRSGDPAEISLPKSRTITWSQTPITKFMSCSTTRIAMPQSSARRRTTRASSTLSRGAEAGRRLVEQQHARVHRHRPGDGEQPPFAVREVVDVAVEILVEVELGDRPHDLGAELRIDRPDQVEEVRAQVLRDRRRR